MGKTVISYKFMFDSLFLTLRADFINQKDSISLVDNLY